MRILDGGAGARLCNASSSDVIQDSHHHQHNQNAVSTANMANSSDQAGPSSAGKRATLSSLAAWLAPSLSMPSLASSSTSTSTSTPQASTSTSLNTKSQQQQPSNRTTSVPDPRSSTRDAEPVNAPSFDDLAGRATVARNASDDNHGDQRAQELAGRLNDISGVDTLNQGMVGAVEGNEDASPSITQRRDIVDPATRLPTTASIISNATASSHVSSQSSPSATPHAPTQQGQSEKQQVRTPRRPPSTRTLSALLEPFDTTHPSNLDSISGRIRIPASSRAGADIAEQKTVNQIGIMKSWKYLPFLAHQASKLASAFVSHHVFGPPKKSWGIELTLITTAIRESVQYSHLSSLDMLRRFLNLGQILPVPKDGVVTPVTFTVRKRGLPGILANADAAEDGTREISGEWVVSRRIWRRMQREHYGPASVPSRGSNKTSPSSSRRSSIPSNAPQTGFHPHMGKDKVILFLHGGAYYVMSAATHRYITISVSKYTNCRVFAVNYRLAPECRWPGQMHDAVSAYLRLVQDLKIPPQNIIFAGDSAGGGLTLATMMYLRDHGFPMPCGAIVMSPWVDLTMSCDSWETNAPFDYLRMPSGDDHMNPIASLLGASNVKNLITHPYVSPLFGDFTGFPPLLIQCGDAECLRDEGTLLAHKASLAGVHVYHEVYEDCPHVFQALFFLEASKKAFRSHRSFVKRILSASGRQGSRMDSSNMDREVMSDAHAIKEDGQPELESLPASPQISTRASLPPTHAETYDDDEEDGLEYDDEANPFESVDGSSASATASERGSSTADEADYEVDVVRHPHARHPGTLEGSSLAPSLAETYGGAINDRIGEAAMHSVAGMVHLGASLSPLSHHNLDSVAEEQDESIARMEESEQDTTATTSLYDHQTRYNNFPRTSSAQRLHAYYHQPAASTSSAASSPSSPFTPLPHHAPSASSSSGVQTPSHSRTPTSSAPSSPAMRHRQRSLSTLSMASMLPSPAHGSAPPTANPAYRPGHSRSSSSASVVTMRPGLFREASKPRARANSHPDLQALLDSYESAGPAQHTVVWSTEGEDASDGMEVDENAFRAGDGHGQRASRSLPVSDAEGGDTSMEDED